MELIKTTDHIDNDQEKEYKANNINIKNVVFVLYAISKYKRIKIKNYCIYTHDKKWGATFEQFTSNTPFRIINKYIKENKDKLMSVSAYCGRTHDRKIIKYDFATKILSIVEKKGS